MQYDTIQRRKHQRYDFCSRIEYVLTSDDTHEIFKGVTMDISQSGLRLYMFAPHHEGQRIRIKSKLPEDLESATICWIKKRDGDLYEAGLKRAEIIDTHSKEIT